MLSELPEIFRCVRPGQGDWILFDASSPPSSLEKNLSDMDFTKCEKKVKSVSDLSNPDPLSQEKYSDLESNFWNVSWKDY